MASVIISFFHILLKVSNTGFIPSLKFTFYYHSFVFEIKKKMLPNLCFLKFNEKVTKSVILALTLQWYTPFGEK